MPKEKNLARLLLERFRWFDEALLAALDARLDVRLTSAQSLVFAELPIAGARQADLARRLGVTRQSVNELVRGLEAQGLVEVLPDPDSGRSKLVRPTALGKRSIKVATQTFERLETELRDGIGDRDVDQLRRVLDADWGRPPPPR